MEFSHLPTQDEISERIISWLRTAYTGLPLEVTEASSRRWLRWRDDDTHVDFHAALQYTTYYVDGLNSTYFDDNEGNTWILVNPCISVEQCSAIPLKLEMAQANAKAVYEITSALLAAKSTFTGPARVRLLTKEENELNAMRKYSAAVRDIVEYHSRGMRVGSNRTIGTTPGWNPFGIIPNIEVNVGKKTFEVRQDTDYLHLKRIA